MSKYALLAILALPFGITLIKFEDAIQQRGPFGFLLVITGWVSLLIATTLGFLIWRERRRQRVMDQKICLECGYDLRASVGRCPECGKLFDRPVLQST